MIGQQRYGWRVGHYEKIVKKTREKDKTKYNRWIIIK